MRRFPTYLILVLGSALCLVPFVWTVSTALKTKQQVAQAPMELLPRTPRWTGPDGKLIPVSVLVKIDAPAAVVELEARPAPPGARPQPPRILPVPASAIIGEGAAVKVKLPAAPAPANARVIERFSDGVAHVRTWPDGPHAQQEKFVPAPQVSYVVDPQFRNFYPPNPNNLQDRNNAAWTALPVPFHVFVLNTYTITIINIIGQTLSCSLVAYGFARFRFHGRRWLFLLLLSTMMLPGQVTMIPVFLIWNKVHLVDTFGPLTIPSFFAQNAFFVFLLRQFFLSIPRELDEAAMLDGCGPFRIWWQILLPLSKPALTTVAVLAFISHWDDFFGPLVYLNSLPNYTVSLALRLFQDQNGSEFHLLMAAALMHIVPVVLLFFLAQRFFVKGIAMTGLKA